jgi:hypothetical protein
MTTRRWTPGGVPLTGEDWNDLLDDVDAEKKANPDAGKV